jgi:hypothetical protein
MEGELRSLESIYRLYEGRGKSYKPSFFGFLRLSDLLAFPLFRSYVLALINELDLILITS